MVEHSTENAGVVSSILTLGTHPDFVAERALERPWCADILVAAALPVSALQLGQNIVVVSKRLGHSSVSITSDIYAHSLPGWQKHAADSYATAMKRG